MVPAHPQPHLSLLSPHNLLPDASSRAENHLVENFVDPSPSLQHLVRGGRPCPPTATAERHVRFDGSQRPHASRPLPAIYSPTIVLFACEG